LYQVKQESDSREDFRVGYTTAATTVVPVDVEYRALTGEGLVRHPSFKGIRRDLRSERSAW
jgi:hypothetical protein